MSRDALDIIRKRRTVRKFTGEDVSSEQIDTLIELAMCAPSRLDRQPWHFVVIRDKALQKQIAETVRVHPYLEQAPVVVAVAAVPSLSPTWAMDTSAAIENMLIAATAMDLGTAWVGDPDSVLWSMCEELLRDTLLMPAEVRIAALVAVGHPQQELPAHGKQDRFDPLKVHYGRWEQRGTS
jgi:nitroreductase